MAVPIPIPRYFNPSMTVEVLGQTVKFNRGEGLNIGFRIVRSMAQTPDTCEVSIEGLLEERVTIMAALFAALGADTMTVKAGYDGLKVGIFKGDLRGFKGSERRGPAQITSFIADDGGDAFSDTILRISTAGMTASQMVSVAAGAMGLQPHPSVATVLGSADPSAQGPYAATFTGKASDLLTAACRRARCRWWIRDGQIVLGSKGLPDSSRPAVVVPPAAVVSGPSVMGSGLYSAVVFLDPNLVPGSQVVVGGIRGMRLRIEGVVYSGETRGGIWVAQITGRTL